MKVKRQRRLAKSLFGKQGKDPENDVTPQPSWPLTTIQLANVRRISCTGMSKRVGQVHDRLGIENLNCPRMLANHRSSPCHLRCRLGESPRQPGGRKRLAPRRNYRQPIRWYPARDKLCPPAVQYLGDLTRHDRLFHMRVGPFTLTAIANAAVKKISPLGPKRSIEPRPSNQRGRAPTPAGRTA